MFYVHRCVSSCGNAMLRSCLNISKERLDGQGVVWFGLAFNHGKGYANRKLFWHSPFRFPFFESEENENIFLCCGYQSFRKKPGRRQPLLFSLRSSADLPVTESLEDVWLTTANTINSRGDISYVPKISSYRRLRGASTATANVPAERQSSRDPPYVWIFIYRYFIWLKYFCHADRNAERTVAMNWESGRL